VLLAANKKNSWINPYIFLLVLNGWVRVMVFNAYFNNISIISLHGGQFYWWRKPEYTEQTTDLVASHWQTLPHILIWR
jgi:hypothetical protein